LAIGDPTVSNRLAAGSASVAPVVTDPAMRAAEGGALLSQSMAGESSVLAYNDVFRVLASLSAGTAGAVALSVFLTYVRRSAREVQP
jgi:hypothetical protein